MTGLNETKASVSLSLAELGKKVKAIFVLSLDLIGAKIVVILGSKYGHNFSL